MSSWRIEGPRTAFNSAGRHTGTLPRNGPGPYSAAHLSRWQRGRKRPGMPSGRDAEGKAAAPAAHRSVKYRHLNASIGGGYSEAAQNEENIYSAKAVSKDGSREHVGTPTHPLVQVKASHITRRNNRDRGQWPIFPSFIQSPNDEHVAPRLCHSDIRTVYRKRV